MALNCLATKISGLPDLEECSSVYKCDCRLRDFSFNNTVGTTGQNGCKEQNTDIQFNSLQILSGKQYATNRQLRGGIFG
jgi:hypothetical protein